LPITANWAKRLLTSYSLKTKGVNSLAHQIKIVIKGDVHVYGTVPQWNDPPFIQDDELLGEIAKQKPEITFNTTRTNKNGKKAPDGIEIRFGTARPTEPVRQELKDHGFQFSERQTMWYAIDNPTSRALAEKWVNEDVEVDTTQYEKRNFWARVKSRQDYESLRERTEFWVKADPPKYFYTKSYLVRAFNVQDLIDSDQLYFRKYYNVAVGEDEPGSEEATSNEEAANNRDVSEAIADKLELLADGMQKEIDAKINSATSRQRSTARRRRISASMREDGYRLQAIQQVLYALSGAHRTGNIENYPFLKNIRTKSQVGLLGQYGYAIKHSWSQDSIQGMFDRNKEALQRLGITSVYEWSLAEGQKSELLQEAGGSPPQKHTEQQQRIKELEDEVWKMNIPGFFPTPQPLIERMLDLADLRSAHTVLEPSAGKGDILDAIANRFPAIRPKLFAIEINSSLAKIIELKGYNYEREDFLKIEPGIYHVDRIIMNPPFENSQDVDHVTHALKMLNANGRLVAIMGEGVFFRQFKKDVAFRKLLQEKNAFISEPIKEAFKNAFNSTGVNVRIVAINADGSPVITGQSSNQSNMPTTSNKESEDMELLQLEAQAELELLKMRVELERKRRMRTVEGIPTIKQDKLQEFRRKAWALQNDVDILDFK
jgi:hypothetical protein